MTDVPLLWRYLRHVIMDELSSFTLVEQIKYIGHYHDVVTFKKDTQKIDKGRYTPEMLKEMDRRVESKFTDFTSLGVKFTKPLNNFRSEIFNFSAILYDGYQKGLLPFPGSLSEQPAQIMEIFSVIESLNAEQNTKRSQKINQEIEKNNKKKRRK